MRSSAARPPRRVRYAFAQAGDHLQLVMFQRMIGVNRSVARLRRWLAPVAGWLWAPPLMLILGFVGGYLSQVR